MIQFQSKKIFSTILILTLSAILILPSCSKDSTEPEPEGEAPAVPPQSTFAIDFSVFPDTTSPASLQKGLNMPTYANWGWAAVNVAIWNSLITLGMVVPTVAFIETIKDEPELQPDGRWLWEANFMVAGTLHTSNLYGRTVSDGVEWEMYISKEGAYQNFKWYTGLSNLPATEGYWELYRDPNNQTKFIRIDWHRNPQQGTADIKYTNIVPNGPENGGYIFYGVTTDTLYDAFYDIYNKGQDNHTDMKWHRITHEGRVQDAMHFGDSDWHCWDMNLMDTVCP